MHSYWVRANAVVFFSIALLGALCFGCWLTGSMIEQKPVVEKFQMNTLKRLSKYKGIDRAVLTFDTSFDLTSVFHWNVKQLFVFVTASYKSESHKRNEIVIYDRVITRSDSPIVRMDDVYGEYPLIDIFEDLRNRDVNFTLNWDIMPYFGPLQIQSKGSFQYTLPTVYK